MIPRFRVKPITNRSKPHASGDDPPTVNPNDAVRA